MPFEGGIQATLPHRLLACNFEGGESKTSMQHWLGKIEVLWSSLHCQASYTLPQGPICLLDWETIPKLPPFHHPDTLSSPQGPACPHQPKSTWSMCRSEAYPGSASFWVAANLLSWMGQFNVTNYDFDNKGAPFWWIRKVWKQSVWNPVESKMRECLICFAIGKAWRRSFCSEAFDL